MESGSYHRYGNLPGSGSVTVADLPQKTEIWAGGGLVHELELTARNVRLFSNLDHIPQALRVQRNAISRCSVGSGALCEPMRG